MTQQDLFPRQSAKLDAWSFTGDFGRNFERLINLQMWCFGCDIRRPEGNLLTDFGFTKTRPPEGVHGSTRYELSSMTGYSLHLWGFGMVITDGAWSLCVKRFDRIPKILRINFDGARTFKPHDLPAFHEPRTAQERVFARRLLDALGETIIKYETYLFRRHLTSFRNSCVGTAPRAGRLQGGQGPQQAWVLLQPVNTAPLS